MQLKMEEITEEGCGERLQPPDALAHAIYQLYNLPPSADLPADRRVVVLQNPTREEARTGGAERERMHLGAAEAAQLLHELLTSDGQRTGIVVFDSPPQPDDVVLQPEPEGYLVSMPRRRALADEDMPSPPSSATH